MSPIWLVLFALAAALTVFSCLWVYQWKGGDSGIVDVAWGMSVGILATLFCIFAAGDPTRRIVVTALALTWAVRLSWHVFLRLQKHEDGRYTEMVEKWGADANRKMFQFYMFQALASVLFALPMLIAAANPSEFGWLDIVGVIVWVVAITGESVADHQLNAFRNDPGNRGKVCQDGWWRYSRHPNYFFEWVHWWSYVFLAITYSYGWLAIVFPMAMLFFILKVTGIPPTERQALKSRGEAYRAYQRSTSPFFPWWPKQESESFS